MTLLALLFALGATAQPQTKSGLRLSISLDREEYVQNGLVRVTATMSNIGDQPVSWLFGFDPRYFPSFSLLYRKLGTPFLRFGYRPNEDFVDSVFVGEEGGPLGPGAAYSRVVTLSYNSALGRFVLDSPGEYEFRASYERPGRPHQVFESNVVRVKVAAPDPREQEACAAYTPDLARLAQLGPFPGAGRLIEPAMDFYERYPDSVFAGPVGEGLMPILAVKVRDEHASPRESAVYETLRERFKRQREAPLSQ